MEKQCLHPQALNFNLNHFSPSDQSTNFPSPSQSQSGMQTLMHAPIAVDPGVTDGRKRFKQSGEAAERKGDSLEQMNLTCYISEDDASVPAVKCGEPSDIAKNDNEADAKTFPHSSGRPNKVSAKSMLHEICAGKNWKAPLFECCEDEGPFHRKLYTFKVIVEIAAPSTILVCLSDPWPKKKTAAEHAAEGALCYLKNLGYLPTKKLKK